MCRNALFRSNSYGGENKCRISSLQRREFSSPRRELRLTRLPRLHLRQFKKARAEGADAAVIKTAVVSVDKAAGKGLIHKNKAARLKSQLAKKANATA